MKIIFQFLFFCLFGLAQAQAANPLEISQDTPYVLHLKGTPYQLGYQHGQHLKNAIAYNVKRLIDDKILANPEHPQIKSFLAMLPKVIAHVPSDYMQELAGLAEGAEQPLDKIILMNLFPEMFHCTALTLNGEATTEGKLYHVRVLDYSAASGLQDTAVLMVFQPDGKIPFINVSFAGFIGSVTGMNAQRMAIGEIGGKGYGRYDGIPMAFLLRLILEKATSLDDAKEILSSSQRTCEYYYVFSDGKTGEAIGVYATPEQLKMIHPGETYAIFSGEGFLSSENKEVLGSDQIVITSHQIALYRDQEKKNLRGLIHYQPANCLAMTGFTQPLRHPILIQRVLEQYGTIGITELQEIIKTPVAHKGNLHNAIFAPESLEAWIAHAGPQNEPACDRPYYYFNMEALLK